VFDSCLCALHHLLYVLACRILSAEAGTQYSGQIGREAPKQAVCSMVQSGHCLVLSTGAALTLHAQQPPAPLTALQTLCH